MRKSTRPPASILQGQSVPAKQWQYALDHLVRTRIAWKIECHLSHVGQRRLFGRSCIRQIDPSPYWKDLDYIDHNPLAECELFQLRKSKWKARRMYQSSNPRFQLDENSVVPHVMRTMC